MEVAEIGEPVIHDQTDGIHITSRLVQELSNGTSLEQTLRTMNVIGGTSVIFIDNQKHIVGSVRANSEVQISSHFQKLHKIRPELLTGFKEHINLHKTSVPCR